MSRPVHWHRSGHGYPLTRNVRQVTCERCIGMTGYTLAVFAQLGRYVAGLVGEAIGRGWDRMRGALIPATPSAFPGFCQARKTEGGYTWACHWRLGHPGEIHNDRSHGRWIGPDSAAGTQERQEG